ncbi:MAG TPA: hypothetical protein VI488_12700 [Candidatus Angelobacter sp.]
MLKLFAFALLVLGLGTLCAAQTHCVWSANGSFSGKTYSNSKLGLSYTYPDPFTPQDASLLPKDPKGKGSILFALWKTPRDIEVPSVVLFVDDPTQYPDPSVIAYVHRIANTAAAHDAQILGTRPFDLAGMKFYRLDIQYPDQNPPYSTSITGQIANCEVSFQLRARTQDEIEKLVQSIGAVKPAKQP